ncbi:MAG: hypothetical protein GTO41_08450, partial [Burkholderiales bacterium]|nr:hypothetical protein [Burkholderiales bacterium]
MFIGYREEQSGLAKEFFAIAPDGSTQMALASAPYRYRGIAFFDEPPFPVPAHPDEGQFLYGVNPNVNVLSQVDKVTGE